MKFKDGKTFSAYVRSKLHSGYITRLYNSYHFLYDYTFVLLNSLDQETLISYVGYPNHITGDDVVF